MRVRPRLLTCVIAGLALLILAWGPVRIHLPVSGQVIDADTKRPIHGAAVRLDAAAICSRPLQHFDWHNLPVLETRTDGQGRFTIPGRTTTAPCMFPTWREDLTILAPGYFEASVVDDPLLGRKRESVRSGLFELDPMRYRAEFDEFRLRAQDRLASLKGSVLGDTLASVRNLRFKPAGPIGVFASIPDAVLDRVAVIRRFRDPDLLRSFVILAQDRNTGAFHGWTTKGDELPVPLLTGSGLRLVSGQCCFGRNSGHLLARQDRIYLPESVDSALRGLGPEDWFPFPSRFGKVQAGFDVDKYLLTLEADGMELGLYDLELWVNWAVPRRKPNEPRQVLPAPHLKVSEVLLGGQPPIECMTRPTGALDDLLFFAHSSEGRAMFSYVYRRDSGGWKAEHVDLPRGTLSAEVMACSGGRDSVYVALKNQGILRLERRAVQGRYIWRVTHAHTPRGPSGPLNFVHFALGEIHPFGEVLYAVARDEAIYRFSAYLQPDQRIMFENPPEGANDSAH